MNVAIALAHPWFGTWTAAVVAALVALLAHRLGGVLLLRIARSAPVPNGLMGKARTPSKAVLALLALQAIWQASPGDLRWIVSVRHLNGVLLIAATTWLVARIIGGLAQGVLDQHPVDVGDGIGARHIHTQTRVLSCIATTLVVVMGVAILLVTFPGARQVGASLLASVGVVGLIAGFGAKPMFCNSIARLRLALTHPIRLDDVLIVDREWGRVEEITDAYVVLRLWGERRLIIPLQYLIENPIQNWTLSNAQLSGSVSFHVDYGMPVAPLRNELERIVRAAPEWDQRFFNLVITDVTERTKQIRVLFTAASSGQAWDLRCVMREGLIDFMQREVPQFLPGLRIEENDDAPLRTAPVQASCATVAHLEPKTGLQRVIAIARDAMGFVLTVALCGFNRSMQQIDGIVQPVYRSLGSSADVH